MFGTSILASVLSAAVAMQSAGAGRAGTAPDPPAVAKATVTAVVYDTDGNVTSVSQNTRAGDFTLYVYGRRTICEISATDVLPDNAAFGWRVHVRPGTASFAYTPIPEMSRPTYRVSIDTATATVQADWQRMWEGGQPATQNGSASFRFNATGRAPLDTINTNAVPGCSGTRITLYVAPEGSGRGGLVGGGFFGGGGGGRVGGQQGRPGPQGGVGPQGGAGPHGGSGQQGQPTGGGGFGNAGGGGRAGAGTVQRLEDDLRALSELAAARGGGGRAGAGGFGGVRPIGTPCSTGVPEPTHGVRVVSGASCAIADSKLDPSTLHVVGAEVWLVHGLPGGTEEVLYQKLAPSSDGKFTFAPVTIEGATGRSTVEVRGYTFAQRLADGKENLDVGMVRSMSVDGRSQGVGTSGKVVPLPRGDDVVSFEIPRDPNYAWLAGHQFSLRVRVTH